jgi:hypothetical protein
MHAAISMRMIFEKFAKFRSKNKNFYEKSLQDYQETAQKKKAISQLEGIKDNAVYEMFFR